MLIRYVGAGVALLFVASLAPAQSKAPAKKQKPDAGLGNLLGAPRVDQAAAERGREIFVTTCGFCHGNDARGRSGPDLVRSTLVLHDNKGNLLLPFLHHGRPNRGMPAFPSLSDKQVTDISVFLHSRAAAVSNRFAYKIGDVVTGDPAKGRAFFDGAGHCDTCHSPTGDLAHVASKYTPVQLQRRMLYPAPNMIDVFLGKAVKPAAPTKVTVHLPSGKEVSGILDHVDEFSVSLHDSSGWYHSYSRKDVKVDVQDPRAEHVKLLPLYTDADMHNVLAYLETLK